MSELGELLELVHDAHAGVSTLQAEYRDWARPRPSLEVTVDRSQLGEAQPRWRAGGPFPTPMADRRRIWLQAPDSLRVEVVVGERLVRFGIRVGGRWWRWDRKDGATTSEIPREGGWGIPPLLDPPLVDPAKLLAAFHLHPAGDGVRAGRRVLRARGRPRKRGGAEAKLAYEFEFDAEHGTILRHTTADNGQLVSITEAFAARYGAPIEPERFTFAAPDGEQPRRVQLAPAIAQ